MTGEAGPASRVDVAVTVVDVSAALAEGGGPVAARAAALLPAELADRLGRVVEPERWRRVTAHAALRVVVGDALGLPPGAVRVEARHGGQPVVAGRPEVEISLSHGGDCAAVAVSFAGRVGVDVEPVGRRLDVDGMLPLTLAPGEPAPPAALPAAERAARFLRLWVRKEAVLKALGLGLPGDLTAVATTMPEPPPAVAGSAPVELVRAPAEAGPVDGWSLYDVEAPGGHVCAVAVEARTGPPAVRVCRLADLLRAGPAVG